jgi:hypothetical protein
MNFVSWYRTISLSIEKLENNFNIRKGVERKITPPLGNTKAFKPSGDCGRIIKAAKTSHITQLPKIKLFPTADDELLNNFLSETVQNHDIIDISLGGTILDEAESPSVNNEQQQYLSDAKDDELSVYDDIDIESPTIVDKQNKIALENCEDDFDDTFANLIENSIQEIDYVEMYNVLSGCLFRDEKSKQFWFIRASEIIKTSESVDYEKVDDVNDSDYIISEDNKYVFPNPVNINKEQYNTKYSYIYKIKKYSRLGQVGFFLKIKHPCVIKKIEDNKVFIASEKGDGEVR